MESTKNRTQIPGDVHHTQSCLDAQMHKRLNVFSAESWSTLKLWINSSEDATGFCMWLRQEPWRQDGNRRRHLGNSKHDQSWENEARCMLGHDVPAPKNVADYVRPMHIELSLYCIVSVKTHPPPRTPTPRTQTQVYSGHCGSASFHCCVGVELDQADAVWQWCEGLSEEKSRSEKHKNKTGKLKEKREGGGVSNGEEWVKWAKLMVGGYYIQR